jgi:O-antigen/teichoic acid export membrane protein
MIERALPMLFKQGRPRGFLRDMLVSASGIAGGQLLVLMATPVLARLYAPAEFGVYASLVVVSGILSTGAALRLDAALPSTLDGETPAMVRLGVLACVAMLLLASIAMVLGLYRFLPWPAALAGSLSILCALTGAMQGLLNIFCAALIRKGRFANTAVLRIVQPAAFIVAALCMIPGGLPIAFAMGVAVAVGFGLVFSWRPLVMPAKCGMGDVARKYWEFPLISLPVAMMDTFALAMPLLFIAQYYGAAAAGNYAQVQRLSSAPLLLCAAAIAQVFYKHAGDAVRRGQSPRPLMWNTVRSLGLMGGVLIALAVLAGEPVLSLFLGAAWRTDLQYLLLLLVPVVIRTIVSPVTSLLLLAEKVRLAAAWQILYAATTWTVLSFMSRRAPLEDLLLVVLMNELVMYLLYLWMTDRVARGLERRSIRCAE